VKKAPGIYLCLLGLWLLQSCSSPRIITYAHPTADFDRYQTFTIAPHKKVEALSRKGHETYQRLDTVIHNQLVARGYQPHSHSDLKVQYEISTGLSQDTPNNNYYNSYNSYSWYYPNYSYSSQQQDIEGMIEILFIDLQTKKTVWTGSADINLKRRGKDQVERMEQYIRDIFTHFQYTAQQ
jgi:hypothetical protein